MRSNYKQLGDYIKEVKKRNGDGTVTKLLGINIDKYYMPSVANIVGTDMSVYKVVDKNQFACNRMHVGRDKRLPVALSRSDEKFIVSPAYDVFEIRDSKILDPEYLMMWFSRMEFDRNAWFYTDADVRGGLNWKAFCDMELPIPSPEKQKEIVAEYHTIVNRIDLNQRLIQKLEETAQAIYKQWFVDFEFPNEEGKPYKSSGGEMVESELGEIPMGWVVEQLQKIISFKNGKAKPGVNGPFPVYGGNGIVEFANKSNEENIIAIGRVGAYCGSLHRVLGKCWVSDNAISAKSKFNMYAYYLLYSLNLNERSEGTGQPLITQGMLNGIKTLIPFNSILETFENAAKRLFGRHDHLVQEVSLLQNFKDLLLSKIATIEN